jgi:hypothetical protein
MTSDYLHGTRAALQSLGGSGLKRQHGIKLAQCGDSYVEAISDCLNTITTLILPDTAS